MFSKQFFKKSLFLSYFLLFFVVVTSVFAQDEVYYADVLIEVKETGLVTITGPTNYPGFIGIENSQNFTSKNGAIWSLNVSSVEEFETFIFEVSLPRYSRINYIKTTPTFRISNNDDKLIIIGTGEDKPFTLFVQYEIDYDAYSFFKNNSRLFLFLSLMTLIFFSIVVTYIITKRVIETKKIKQELKNIEMRSTRDFSMGRVTMLNPEIFTKSTQIEESRNIDSQIKNTPDEVIVPEKKVKYDFNILPERQKDIINILKSKGKITQKELENIMLIPKSSVSRNVRTLEIKGIITKEGIGQTNYLSLKEE